MPTCLANIFRPAVVKSSIKLLRQYGKGEVVLAARQLCCGQASYTNGDQDSARKLAEHNISMLFGSKRIGDGMFDKNDKLILPSGSCASMIKYHYHQLCSKEYKRGAQELAERTMEISEFLAVKLDNGRDKDAADNDLPPIAVHRNCAASREMHLDAGIDKIIKHFTGKVPIPVANSEVCCGFGGTFCAKYPQIAERMGDNKLSNLVRAIDSKIQSEEVGTNNPMGNEPRFVAKAGQNKIAAIITATDLGCLLHLARRNNSPYKLYHLSEVLSGSWRQNTPIGDSSFLGKVYSRFVSLFRLASK